MKTRSFFSVLAAIVLVLVLAGAAGAYWLTTNNPLRLQQGVEQSSAKAGVFISRQAPVMVSLLVNPDRLTAVDLLTAAPTQRKQVQARWRQFRQDLLGSRQLDYNRDIRPWLGNEITLAITTPDLDRDSSNGQQVGYLVAAAIKDAQQAEESIQAYWQKRAIAGLNLVFEQYAGVKIIHDGLATEAPRQADATITSTASPLATAVIADRFVLFANHPKVLRDAINNFQVPELSLEATTPYQQALEQLSDPHIGMVYAYLPQLAAWLGEPSLTEGIDSDITATSPIFDSVVMGLTLNQQSIVSDTMLLASPGQALDPAQSSQFEPGKASQYVPPVTPIAATGQDLYQLWAGLETGLKGYEPLKALLDKPLNALSQQWQLDLLDEVFPWIDGEYALGLLPNPSRTGGDWVFVAERTPTFLSGLAQLDTIAQEQGLTISTFSLAEQSVTAWIKLSVTPVAIAAADRQRQSVTIKTDVQGVHTTVGDYEILATSLDAIAQAIQTGQYSLLTSEELQQSLAVLPTPHQGYLYIDWQDLDNLGNWSAKIEQRLPPIAKPFLDRLRSVTISNYEVRPGSMRSVVVVRL